MAELIPCILERKIVPTRWGGRALESLLGIALPPGEQVGETWELYDRPEGSSPIRGSRLALHDLVRQDAPALLGPRVAPARHGRFPLLLKLIDATESLSVQVHPDDAQAAEEDDDGKSEAWLILHAGPRGRVLRGLVPGVTRERFEPVASTAAVVPLLQEIRPRPDDAIWVPPGTVHSIGPDVVLFEIQRNSNVTYRLFDWDRTGRALHREPGLRALRYDHPPMTTVAPMPAAEGGEWVVRDPHFRLRRWSPGEQRSLRTAGSFKILTVIAGQATVGWRSQDRHEPLLVRRAETVLVPACIEEVYLSPIGRLTVLVSDAGSGA